MEVQDSTKKNRPTTSWKRSDPDIDTVCNKIDKNDFIINSDDIEIQRNYIWDDPEKSSIKSKLIESIIMNIPIPTIYLSEEENHSKETLDGLQRLNTIYDFKNNKLELSGLEFLPDLNGKKYEDLDNDDKTTFNDFNLSIVIFTKENDPNMKAEIFSRYNQGCVELNEQETRNCIFRGYFNEQIKSLKKNNELIRKFFNEYNKDKDRMEIEEIILRGIAHLNFGKMISNIEDKKKYKIKVSNTMQLQNQLNVFMEMYKENKEEVDFMIQDYLDTLQLIYDVLDKDIVKRSNSQTLLFRYDVLLLAFKNANKEEFLQKKAFIKNCVYGIATEIKAPRGNTATQKNIEKLVGIVKDAIERGIEMAAEEGII